MGLNHFIHRDNTKTNLQKPNICQHFFFWMTLSAIWLTAWHALVYAHKIMSHCIPQVMNLNGEKILHSLPTR